MSSHHIVREDQEPALLLMDVQAIEFEQVQELLEWSPTVIVHEGVLTHVLSWGIKVDVVIAHSSNVPDLRTFLHDQFPVKIVSFESTEEALSTALYFLIASKQKVVNIFSLQQLETFELFSTLDLSVFQLGKKWSFIRSGHFDKWLPAGRIVNVLPSNEQMKIAQDGIITIQKEEGFWISEE